MRGETKDDRERLIKGGGCGEEKLHSVFTICKTKKDARLQAESQKRRIQEGGSDDMQHKWRQRKK